MYSTPFYTEVVVSSSSKTTYAVTSVAYTVSRIPATGCPTNTTYRVFATFTTNGPLEFTYLWTQQDGNSQGGKGTVKMTEAGTKTISRDWTLHLGAATNSNRSMAITVLTPVHQEFPQVGFTYDCLGK
jgi:hypothetical protein